jgi:hypothetical protein
MEEVLVLHAFAGLWTLGEQIINLTADKNITSKKGAIITSYEHIRRCRNQLNKNNHVLLLCLVQISFNLSKQSTNKYCIKLDGENSTINPDSTKARDKIIFCYV